MGAACQIHEAGQSGREVKLDDLADDLSPKAAHQHYTVVHRFDQGCSSLQAQLGRVKLGCHLTPKPDTETIRKLMRQGTSA